MSERAEVQENVIVTKEGHYETTRKVKITDEFEDVTDIPVEIYSTRYNGDKSIKESYEIYYGKTYAELIFDAINKSSFIRKVNVDLFCCDIKVKEEDSKNRISTLYEKYGYKIKTIISEFKKVVKEKTGDEINIQKKSPYSFIIYGAINLDIFFSFNEFNDPIYKIPKSRGVSSYEKFDTANIVIFDNDFLNSFDSNFNEYISPMFKQILEDYSKEYISLVAWGNLDIIKNYFIIEDNINIEKDIYSSIISFNEIEDKDGQLHDFIFKVDRLEYIDDVINTIKRIKEDDSLSAHDYSKMFNSISYKGDYSKMFEPVAKNKKKPDYTKWLLDLENEFDEIQGSEKNVMRRCQLLEMMSAVRQFIKEERENQALNPKEKISYPYDLTSIITNEEFLSKNNIMYSNYGWYLIYGTRYEQQLTLNIFGDPNKPKDNDIFIIENFVEKQYEILIYKSGKFLFTSNMCEECTMDILEGFEYRGKLYSFELNKTNLIVKKFYRNTDKFTIIF